MSTYITAIESTWQGQKIPQSYNLSITPEKDTIVITVDAPFYADPAPPGLDANCEGLWNYEVVELFIRGRRDRYIEIEMGPHGHYLILVCDGYRQCFTRKLVPNNYTAKISGDKWTGTLTIDSSMLPPPTDILGYEYSYNAYAIHGTRAEDRVYCCAFPPEKAVGEYAVPDFHRLELFQSFGEEFSKSLIGSKDFQGKRKPSVDYNIVRE